jgi:hypothetical protein
VADGDVERSAELGRVLLLMLRALGEDEDIDGDFEWRRVAEAETTAAWPRVAVKERGTLGAREDEEKDVMSVATGNTVASSSGVEIV